MLELESLRTCEDDFQFLEPVPRRTVICVELWGEESYSNWIGPIIDEQHLIISDLGLTRDGIAIVFRTIKEASIFRLFYAGETAVKNYEQYDPA